MTDLKNFSDRIEKIERQSQTLTDKIKKMESKIDSFFVMEDVTGKVNERVNRTINHQIDIIGGESYITLLRRIEKLEQELKREQFQTQYTGDNYDRT